MVNTTRQDNQITLFEPDPHPVVSFAPDIKESRAVQNVPDLLILVQMLVKEALDLFLVDVSHLFWRDCDLIPVFVTALGSQIIDIGLRGDVMI
jgi:hypothetical protein